MALKFNAKESCLEANIIFVVDKFDAVSKKSGNPFFMIRAVCLNDSQNGTVFREFFCDSVCYQSVTECGYYEVTVSLSGRLLTIKPHSYYQI